MSPIAGSATGGARATWCRSTNSFGSNPSGIADALEIAADEPSAEEGLIRNAERDYVVRGLAKLPPAFREVVVLREIEGLSYREIAQVTGAPVGTVMSRLARGRTELRKVLSRLIEKDDSNAL